MDSEIYKNYLVSKILQCCIVAFCGWTVQYPQVFEPILCSGIYQQQAPLSMKHELQFEE